MCSTSVRSYMLNMHGLTVLNDPNTGGRGWWEEGHNHLRAVPSFEVLPQDPAALGARTGEEVQVNTGVMTHSGTCVNPEKIPVVYC